MPEKPIELIIADDSNIFIECIRHWVDESDEVTLAGTVNNADDLIKLLENTESPIILSTHAWSAKQGKAKISRMIFQHAIHNYALCLSSTNYSSINSLIDMGFKGFFGDVTTREDFIRGLLDLERYNYYMAPEILAGFLEVKQSESGRVYSEKAYLTKRETEILEYILRGKRSREIARALNISKRTVDGHRANINNKFGVRNTAQLYKKAATYLYSL